MFARVFFRNRHLLVLTATIVVLAGVSALLSIPRVEDPRVVNRYPIIIVRAPGMSTERVETLVTKPLEDALQGIDEIKHIQSTSRTGGAKISLELLDSVTYDNVQEVNSKIRDRLNGVQLPDGTEPPVLDDKRRPAYTLITALRCQQDSAPRLGLLNRLAEDLADRLRQVPGTEIVCLYGNPEEEVSVELDPIRLAELELSSLDIAKKVRSADSKHTAGMAQTDRTDLPIEVTGEFDSVQRVARIPILDGEEQSIVRLGDVGTVRKGWRRPEREIALVDGQRCIYVAARTQDGQSVTQWSARARAIVAEASRNIGPSVVIDQIFDQSSYTTERLSNLTNNLLLSALVVLAVVLMLMGWRSALAVGISIPLVLSLVAFTMYLRGYPMHQMSVVGMILAIGLMIDNAIVVCDEVSQKTAKGKTRIQAVQDTIGQLFAPLLASTLTTILAFAPIFLLPGSVGDFVRAIGESVILSVSFSFLVAITVTAALAGTFASTCETDAKSHWWIEGWKCRRLAAAYSRILTTTVRYPVAAILISVLMPCCGFILAKTMGREFFPPTDRDMFQVQVWLPTGSSIDASRKSVEAIERTIRDQSDTKRIWWLIGGSFPTVYYNLVMDQDDVPHYSQAIVSTESHTAVKRIIPQLQEALSAQFPEAQIVLRQFGQGPPVVADIEYRINGPDLKKQQEIGERLRLTLQSQPEVLHTQMTLLRGIPKLWFEANEEDTRLVGFSLVDLAKRMNANLQGEEAGFLLQGLHRLPVRIRYAADVRADLSRIASMPIVQEGNQWTPLSALGDFTLRPELGAITRYDAERCNIVRAHTRNGALPIDITRRTTRELAESGFSLPQGYRIEVGGAAEQDDAAMRNLMVYMPLLVTLAVGILILVFRSIPLAALLGIIPALSVGLGLAATWTAGFPISINTVLGTLGLIGVALNDSIVVLAAIRANSKAGNGDLAEIVHEVRGCTRHVLSTTLTTVGGFLPLVLFVRGQFWPSLAVVMAGGIAGATLLALVFVPAAYIFLKNCRMLHTATTGGSAFD